VADNRAAAGRAKNRRTEVRIIKMHKSISREATR